MKRYVKLIVITALVVITIGTYYINLSMEMEKYPKLVIKHKSGDKAEADDLIVHGEIEDEQNYVFTKVTTEGTFYERTWSYLDVVKQTDTSSYIKQLQKDYRGFMRGKEVTKNQYYEDTNVLAYVNMVSDYSFTGNGQWIYTFEVDVLDKVSKNRQRFDVLIPDSDKYNYLYIQGVQVMDGQIKIMTTNDIEVTSEPYYITRDELHLYSVSLKDGEIIQDEVVDNVKDLDPELYVSTYVIENKNQTEVSEYMVYSTDIFKEITDDEGFYEEEMIEQKITAYNLKTNEQEEINLAKEYGEEIAPEMLSDSTLYLSRRVDQNIELIGYNLKKQAVDIKQSFELPKDDELEFFFTLNKDKIYILQQTDPKEINYNIIVANIKTGDILYEGTVEPEKNIKQTYNLRLSYLQVD